MLYFVGLIRLTGVCCFAGVAFSWVVLPVSWVGCISVFSFWFSCLEFPILWFGVLGLVVCFAICFPILGFRGCWISGVFLVIWFMFELVVFGWFWVWFACAEFAFCVLRWVERELDWLC